jgi:hypothetical protein
MKVSLNIFVAKYAFLFKELSFDFKGLGLNEYLKQI